MNVLIALSIYLIVGFLFSVIFVFFGITKIDPVAKDTGIGFKLIILPGCAVFWPYLMYRLILKHDLPKENTAHKKMSFK